ncbi:MAG: RNA polymerase sigma factor [Frankia sp.]
MFSTLFARYHATIFRYLARRVGPQLAEELAADVFVTAFGTRARYDLTRPDAAPWLYGIAHNLLRGHQRTERRKLRAYARHGVDPLMDEASDAAFVAAERRLDADRSGAAVALALASLRAEERDVLLLVVWAGLSGEAVAEALAVPAGTVRSRLHRAKRRMRDSLEHNGLLATDRKEG